MWAVDGDDDNIPLLESPSSSFSFNETGLEREIRARERDLKMLRSQLAQRVQNVDGRSRSFTGTQALSLELEEYDEPPTASPSPSSTPTSPSGARKKKHGLFRSSSMVAPSSDF
mmetsp:Transcript_851/g.1788  ORF Transcript_851/g.1788 Transcript_851/m.1788 type:complete len:114 (-) Transcript_851:158-499(-)